MFLAIANVKGLHHLYGPGFQILVASCHAREYRRSRECVAHFLRVEISKIVCPCNVENRGTEIGILIGRVRLREGIRGQRGSVWR